MRINLKKKDGVIFGIFLLLNIVFLFFHEVWRDEAEAWVIAGYYSLPQIFYRLSSEGQPALWFLILFPFAKAGLPVQTAGWISLVICSAAAYLFLANCRFRSVYKWIILFSCIFTYYNPVISRNYCLVLLNIVVLIALWRDRKAHPLLYGLAAALLFQTHVMLSGLAIGCMLDQLCLAFREPAGKGSGNTERPAKLEMQTGSESTGRPISAGRRTGPALHLAGAILGFISMGLMILELYQSPEKPFVPAVQIDSIFANYRLYNIWEQIRIALRSLYRFEDEKWYPFIIIAIILLIAVLSFLQVWRGIQGKFVVQAADTSSDQTAIDSPAIKHTADIAGWMMTVWLGIAAYLLIIIYIRPANHAQLSIVFMMILLFAVCTAEPCRIFPARLSYLWNVRILFILLCVVGWPRLFRSSTGDITQPFSQGKAMASYIEENLPDDAVIAVKADYCIPSVSAYLKADNRDPGHTDTLSGVTVWNLCTDEEFINYQWGYEYPLPDLGTVRNRFSGRELFYLTSSSFEAVIPIDEIELVHAADGYSLMGESFYLYRIK